MLSRDHGELASPLRTPLPWPGASPSYNHLDLISEIDCEIDETDTICTMRIMRSGDPHCSECLNGRKRTVIRV